MSASAELAIILRVGRTPTPDGILSGKNSDVQIPAGLENRDRKQESRGIVFNGVLKIRRQWRFVGATAP